MSITVRTPNGSALQQVADPARWADIGYRPFPLGEPTTAGPVTLPTVTLPELNPRYEFVVIGSGAGGGVAAMVLAESGASVLVVERGRWLQRDEIPVDHLRNHRFFACGDSTSPTGHPRAVRGVDGRPIGIDPHHPLYLNNAITLGGGTRVFGAQAWRFLPDDFRMASIYGVPADSALADWPIGYDDLAPFYDLVEREIGVSGAAVHPSEPLAGRSYPMPPLPHNAEAVRLVDAAHALGWQTGPVPLLVNSVERDGRPACARCGFCVGFACPVEAKNGTQVTALPRAAKAGAHIIAETQVVRISGSGAVVLHHNGTEQTVHAGRIVLAAGAIETARLLQVSGLGNDWVGDCLQGHTYTGAFGVFDDDVADGLGPGPSIATRQFSHGVDGIVGGGLLANDFVKIPSMFLAWALPPDIEPSVEAVEQLYRRTMHVLGPAQEIPTRRARVRTTDSVVDAAGVPVALLEGTQHPLDLAIGDMLAQRAEQWVAAAGAMRTWQHRRTTPELSGGQHQAGTARMSEAPRFGATDPFGRLWGSDRIVVCDASVHVTNGGCNPVLTIMALAWRAADHLLRT